MFRVFPSDAKLYYDDFKAVGKKRRDEAEEKKIAASLSSIVAKVK